MPIFIIEHLEPALFPWCLLEYKHISKIVGKRNLWFTNIKDKDKNKLSKYGKVFTESIKQLINKNYHCHNVKTHLYFTNKNICILDPEAKKTLTPK